MKTGEKEKYVLMSIEWGKGLKTKALCDVDIPSQDILKPTLPLSSFRHKPWTLLTKSWGNFNVSAGSFDCVSVNRTGHYRAAATSQHTAAV